MRHTLAYPLMLLFLLLASCHDMATAEDGPCVSVQTASFVTYEAAHKHVLSLEKVLVGVVPIHHSILITIELYVPYFTIRVGCFAGKEVVDHNFAILREYWPDSMLIQQLIGREHKVILEKEVAGQAPAGAEGTLWVSAPAPQLLRAGTEHNNRRIPVVGAAVSSVEEADTSPATTESTLSDDPALNRGGDEDTLHQPDVATATLPMQAAVPKIVGDVAAAPEPGQYPVKRVRKIDYALLVVLALLSCLFLAISMRSRRRL